MRGGAARRARRDVLGARRFAGPGVQPIDVAMMRRALLLARRAARLGEVPVGAVIYRGREIVGEGSNLREASRDPLGHAEIIAIAAAAERLGRWRLTDCSMAVTLEPCPMCAGALVNARLGRLLFGAVDPKAGACGTLYSIPTDERLNHRVTVIGGVLPRECGGLLSAFFRERRAEARQRRSQKGVPDASPPARSPSRKHHA